MMSVISPRRWSREEYDRMVGAGILHEDERVQLIEGEILQMTPQYRCHAAAVLLTTKALETAFGPAYSVQGQVPLAVSDDSEPEPDVAVVAGSIRGFLRDHPTTAVLIVEVADSSLMFDRRRKARLYARCGMPEYWIVNLADRCLEVHREPRPDAGTADGIGRDAHYADIRVLDEHAAITPLAAPGLAAPGTTVRVADLLP
jgi:Uma2 family endonuclease